MARVWEKGNLTVRNYPQACDQAKCEYCGRVGKVGREVFIAWGISVITAYCRKGCADATQQETAPA